MNIVWLCSILAYGLCLSPPTWGGNPRYKVSVSMLNDSPQMKWNFMYYYDSILKVERYEHTAPQADIMCSMADPPFTINDSCVVTFATDGWSYIEYPKWNWCCKCENSFGYIKPDWLQQNSTFAGTQTKSGYTVNHWIKEGNQVNNYYCTVDKSLPVQFYQQKNGIPKAWDFDLTTYSTAPLNPQLFKPKCSALCSGRCETFRK